MDTNTSNNITDQKSQGDLTSNPPVQGTNPALQGDQGNPANEELKQKIAELERDNRKYRQERKQQDEAAALAEQQRLKEQGEFKQLAEQHAARVQELEPLQGRLEQAEKLLAEHITAQTKNWPAEVKALLPDESTPIEQRYAQVQKLQAFVDKLTQQSARPGNHNPVKPASGEPTSEQQVDQKMRQLRASRKYF